MLNKGINVSLGHDCFFSLDVSEYIRYAYLVHKAHKVNNKLHIDNNYCIGFGLCVSVYSNNAISQTYY